MRSERKTCARCGGSGGADYRLTIACARRAGMALLAGAEHLHHACAAIIVAMRRARG
jgi:hypothetical protein